MGSLRSVVRFWVLLALALLTGCSRPADSGPRLLVTVVVDGFSARQLARHEPVLDGGGFRRLLDEGAVFDRARFAHTTTFTAPGHGTIATGTSPHEHGLVGNAWFDRRVGRRMYCVGDPDCTTVGGRQRKRGASGRNLLVPTLADALDRRSEGHSRSLAISLKDRGSVIGAGVHGLAFWFDNDSGRFQSSSRYLNAMPQWWIDYYAAAPQDRYLEGSRNDLPHAQPWHEEYRAIVGQLRAEGVRVRDFDRFAVVPDPRYYRSLKSSPRGDDLTFEFAAEALRNSDLGRVKGRVDQLFVSFSAHDYVAHDVGPDSPQASAVVENLDRLLAEFFDLLDATIGDGKWVLAFTADHGYPDTPEVVLARGEDAGRLDPEQLARDLDHHLDQVFGAQEWVQQWAVPTFYLASAEGVEDREIRREAQLWLQRQPGVFRVYRRDELEGHGSARDSMLVSARESFQPERSGDLLVLQKPHWYLLYDPRADVCTHGSPWADDREVPLIFLGDGVAPGRFHDEAHVRDLAPTLLALAGQPPGGWMTGRVLRTALASNHAR